ncbi:hypothetical protein TWF730_006201 [Orbilia blumenaviensis]|uniref:Uncharacterized protein n=1 Tax=Orbilia blumenaviensis TaxID=1796055 RepID=A0AAV9TW06_9PEZI
MATDSTRSNSQTPSPISDVLAEVSDNSQTIYRGPRRPLGLPLQTDLKVCGGSQIEDEKPKKENINPVNSDGGIDIEELIRRLTGG